LAIMAILAISLAPHPPFFQLLLKTKAEPQIDPCVALGRRLGHPWATLGSPKGHPWATQSNPKSGRGSQRFTKYQIPSTGFPASRQLQFTRGYFSNTHDLRTPPGNENAIGRINTRPVHRRRPRLRLLTEEAQHSVKPYSVVKDRTRHRRGLLEGIFEATSFLAT
jgi:hypothetical protein